MEVWQNQEQDPLVVPPESAALGSPLPETTSSALEAPPVLTKNEHLTPSLLGSSITGPSSLT